MASPNGDEQRSNAFEDDVLQLIRTGVIDNDTDAAAEKVRELLVKHYPPDDDLDDDSEVEDANFDNESDTSDSAEEPGSKTTQDIGLSKKDDPTLHTMSMEYLRTLLIREKLEKLHEVIEGENQSPSYEELDAASKDLAEVIRMQDALDGSGEEQWGLMQEQLALLLKVKAGKEEGEGRSKDKE